MAYNMNGWFEYSEGNGFYPKWDNPCDGTVGGFWEEHPEQEGKYRPYLEELDRCGKITGHCFWSHIDGRWQIRPRLALEYQYQCCHGEDCLACWNTETAPRAVKATISGITTCSGYTTAPSGEHWLDQDPLSPCDYKKEWEDGGDTYHIIYRASRSREDPACGPYACCMIGNDHAPNGYSYFWGMAEEGVEGYVDECGVTFENFFDGSAGQDCDDSMGTYCCASQAGVVVMGTGGTVTISEPLFG